MADPTREQLIAFVREQEHNHRKSAEWHRAHDTNLAGVYPVVSEERAAMFAALRARLEQEEPVYGYGSEVLCPNCAVVFCPEGERLHFHHDGCPACVGRSEATTPPRNLTEAEEREEGTRVTEQEIRERLTDEVLRDAFDTAMEWEAGEYRVQLTPHIEQVRDVLVAALAPAPAREETPQQCTGPFSDARDCPVHNPKRECVHSELAAFCQSEGPRGETICMLPLGHDGPCGWERLSPAPAEARRPQEEQPYFVEVDSNGCERCHSGKTWTVVGPDGDQQSQSFDNEEDAEYLADALNEAYALGTDRQPSTPAAPAPPTGEEK